MGEEEREGGERDGRDRVGCGCGGQVEGEGEVGGGGKRRRWVRGREMGETEKSVGVEDRWG